MELTSLDSVGKSGGILIMWDPQIVKVYEQLFGEFSLTLSCEAVYNGE